VARGVKTGLNAKKFAGAWQNSNVYMIRRSIHMQFLWTIEIVTQSSCSHYFPVLRWS